MFGMAEARFWYKLDHKKFIRILQGKLEEEYCSIDTSYETKDIVCLTFSPKRNLFSFPSNETKLKIWTQLENEYHRNHSKKKKIVPSYAFFNTIHMINTSYFASPVDCQWPWINCRSCPAHFVRHILQFNSEIKDHWWSEEAKGLKAWGAAISSLIDHSLPT